MAEITNPQAIAFSNERVRPMCERIRALKAEIDDTMTHWFAGVNGFFAVGEDTLEDGREAEGISRLTAADITAVAVIMQSIQTTLNVAGVAAQVQKPCVRPLQVG